MEIKSEASKPAEEKPAEGKKEGEKKEGERRKNKKPPAGFLLIVFALVAAAVYWSVSAPPKSNPSEEKVKAITQEEAKTKIEKFINENLMSEGTQATIKEVSLEGDLYKVLVDIGNGQIITSYLTKDGQKFFPQVMNIQEIEKQKAEAKKQEEEASKPAPKSDKPEVDLYVMSFCPYGNKAEDTLKPVYNLLKDKVNFNFHYIVAVEGGNIQSLHGQKEVDQNEREACVLKNYGKDAWMNFVTYVNSKCGSDGSCWEAGAKSLSIDTAKISACVSSDGLALMKENADASSMAGANGSPTLVINGKTTKTVYQYGNSEAYKKAICDAFNTAPAECSAPLSSDTSTAEGGSCGS